MVLVLAGFIVSEAIHLQPSLVALLGAGTLILISGLEQSDYLANVEWDTLLFMVGLFIMVGALFKTGVIKTLGQMAADATGGNVLLTTMLILGVSMLLSGIIDNVPYVATMTPIVSHLASVIPGQAHHDVDVVVIGSRWRPRWQSHRCGIQRQHCHGRNRAEVG